MDNIQNSTSHRKLRKRASTQAMKESAEPNKRTDRSQDRDDNQTMAHVLQTEIRGKRQTEVRQSLSFYCCECTEDVSSGGECQLCGHVGEWCPECLHKRISVDQSHELNQANKHHDVKTNPNQTSAVPATHLSQAIEIDEDPDTEAEYVLYKKLEEELEQNRQQRRQQKRETWVNQTIKCCCCEGTSSAVNRCVCGHKYCGICFRYSDEPDATTGELVRDLYHALLRMRRDIDKNIAILEEPLQHLSGAETIGDIQKYLKEFSTAFSMLSSLFTKLAGFTSCALGMDVETGKLNGLRWHITSLWEEYGHIQQIMYTCSLCGQLPDAKLRRGVENLREKMVDLQVVCEGRTDQLEADLSEENLEEGIPVGGLVP